jgi:hypothetical protein
MRLDTIITIDTLLTQRRFAQQIVDQQDYYLLIVKANQPYLRDDLALFFGLPAIMADHERWDHQQLGLPLPAGAAALPRPGAVARRVQRGDDGDRPGRLVRFQRGS